MNLSVAEQEMLRARWRRARQPLLLLNPCAEDFAGGGLARRVTEPSVRLLILPPNPENQLMEFDDDFWEWWRHARQDPSSGRSMNWWAFHEPTSAAAVSFMTHREGTWESYLALHRHGGLEMELGSDAVYRSNDRNAFRLSFIFNRVWASLSVHGDAVERYDLRGPFEISLALRNTEGAILGNVAHGWYEPGSGFADIRTCAEPGLLLRREVPEWPDADGTRALAIGLGGWVEDCWGYSARRFLPPSDRV